MKLITASNVFICHRVALYLKNFGIHSSPSLKLLEICSNASCPNLFNWFPQQINPHWFLYDWDHPGPLSEVHTNANLAQAKSRVRTFAEPEFRFHGMHICKNDDQYSTAMNLHNQNKYITLYSNFYHIHLQSLPSNSSIYIAHDILNKSLLSTSWYSRNISSISKQVFFGCWFQYLNLGKMHLVELAFILENFSQNGNWGN